jgi:membrane protein implicated in regulation of membrane protease activity
MDYSILWILFFVVSVLIEVFVSPGLFYFLPFSVGSGCAAIAAYAGYNALQQILYFIGTSAFSFIFLRSLIKRISKDTLHKSNVYALLGKKAVVVETIAPCKKGWVKVDGELWSAASLDESLIEKGTVVEVRGSEGSHLKVTKLKHL